MTNPRRTRSLGFEDWPEADQLLWEDLIQTGDVFDDQGPGAHWRPATQRMHHYAYACWLRFQHDHDPASLALDPLERLNPERVRAFLASLAGIKASTRSLWLTSLKVIAKAVAPDRDWCWLEALVRRADGLARSERRDRPVISSARLMEAGLKRFHAAASSETTNPRLAAAHARDGLMVALLAARPLRKSNFARIAIGRHLVPLDDGYLLTFERHETKTHRPFEVPVPDRLVAPLTTYLEHIRPMLLGNEVHTRLWVNLNGTPMAPHHLYQRIVRATEELVGVPIPPHAFRHCAATSIAVDDPEHVRIGATLLGHATFSTTERHYNQAQTLEAGRDWQRTLDGLRRRHSRCPKPTRKG